MNSSKFSHVLREGAVVYTKLYASNTWIKNTISKIRDNDLYIPLLTGYLSDIISIGNDITIKCSDDYNEYIVNGTITDIKVSNSSYVVVHINNVFETLNTRAFKRYDIFLASNIKSIDDKSAFFSIVTNISLGGMAFISNHEFGSDREAGATILIPDNKLITVKGTIVRKSMDSGIIDYGMKFIEVGPDSEKVLFDYLLALEKREKQN